jgi:hypothetical protein
MRAKSSRLFELALMLVRFDHVASVIKDTNRCLEPSLSGADEFVETLTEVE